MWRPDRWLRSAFWALLALALVPGLVGGASAHAFASSPAPTPGCNLRYAPVFVLTPVCPVPQGATIDPCSTVSLGLTHCPITLPDFNPLDWLNWLYCNLGLAIQTIGNAFVAGFDAVLSAIAAPIVAGLGGITTLIQTSVVSLANAIGTIFGPLAPAVASVFVGAILVLGLIGLYFATVFVFALAKTIFNLF
ncbi:MAG TPA: hypothetical protein VFF67_10290 [Thermoplasmata archaeon]|nr:hypothetical protein [Thermoplasmata archaeon]